MPSLHGLSCQVISPFAPYPQGTAVAFVERVERSAFRPKMEHGARDLFSLCNIPLVVLDIDGGCCPIFLADGMNPLRIAIGLEVFILDLLSEGTFAEWVAEDCVRCAKKVFLWKRRLLRQQYPWPISHCEPGIRMAPPLRDRDHVQYCQPLYLVQMIESKAIRDTAA